MHATNQIQNTTHNAGFAPAPAEAHPEANVSCVLVADAEVEAGVRALEDIWCAQVRQPLVQSTTAAYWCAIRSDIAAAAMQSLNAHRALGKWSDSDGAVIRQIARFDFAVGFDLYPKEFRDSDIACLVWDDGYDATEQSPVARAAAVAELDEYYALATSN